MLDGELVPEPTSVIVAETERVDFVVTVAVDVKESVAVG